MRYFCFIILLVLLVSSCLKSLDDELHTNPLDMDYTGDYIVIDEVTFRDTSDFGDVECNPIIRFHLDPQTADRLKKIDVSDYLVQMHIKFKRTSSISESIQNPTVFKRRIENLVADSIYTIKYDFWWLEEYDDLICPEIYITMTAPNSSIQIPLITQSASQFVECFVCGG